jgi:hypothetical protein
LRHENLYAERRIQLQQPFGLIDACVDCRNKVLRAHLSDPGKIQILKRPESYDEHEYRTIPRVRRALTDTQFDVAHFFIASYCRRFRLVISPRPLN